MALNPLLKKLVEQQVSEASAAEVEEERELRAMVRKEVAPLLAELPTFRAELAELERELVELEQQTAEITELRDRCKTSISAIEEIFILNETGTASELHAFGDAYLQRFKAA